MPIQNWCLFLSVFILVLSGCGDASESESDEASSGQPMISFVQACNLQCDYAHDEPEGCSADLSQSLNNCLQDCALEDSMELSDACKAAGIAYYQCTWALTFLCREGQTEPTPSNLSDCAEQSGEWNACLLGG